MNFRLTNENASDELDILVFFKSLDDFSFIFQAVSLISIFVQAMTVFSITGIIPVSPGFPKVVTE